MSVKENSVKTGSKITSVVDVEHSIGKKFFECCKEFIPDINYENKVYYFLHLLDGGQYFDEELKMWYIGGFFWLF